MAVFVGVPFTLIALRGRRSMAAASAQLYVASGVLFLSALAATEWLLAGWAAVLAIETMIVSGFPSSRSLRRSEQPIRRLLLVVPAPLGLVPASVYALAMWKLNREDRIDADITSGVDHYSVQGGYAVASIVLVALAALWPTAGVLMGVCAGSSAIYFGLVSWAWHPTQGSISQPWSAFTVLWGLVVLILTAIRRPGRGRVGAEGPNQHPLGHDTL